MAADVTEKDRANQTRFGMGSEMLTTVMYRFCVFLCIIMLCYVLMLCLLCNLMLCYVLMLCFVMS